MTLFLLAVGTMCQARADCCASADAPRLGGGVLRDPAQQLGEIVWCGHHGVVSRP